MNEKILTKKQHNARLAKLKKALKNPKMSYMTSEEKKLKDKLLEN